MSYWQVDLNIDKRELARLELGLQLLLPGWVCRGHTPQALLRFGAILCNLSSRPLPGVVGRKLCRLHGVPLAHVDCQHGYDGPGAVLAQNVPIWQVLGQGHVRHVSWREV